MRATWRRFAVPFARADDLQDAQQLLKSGQREQALERVNKVLSAKPKDPQARFLRKRTESGRCLVYVHMSRYVDIN